MKKKAKMTPKGIVLLLALAVLVSLLAVGCAKGGGIQEILSEEEYTYVNPDETRAETDPGFVIDGVLDEETYQNNNWLYLHNDDGGNNVDIAMTSYYGDKGMYFVYDVTETVPIYVNLSRASYMNSCIEMYFAPSSVTSLGENSLFEIDMLPTGDMVFKKSNGKGGYVNVATTDDIMAYLGTTTKGGEVNSEDCYGYTLELFIPWEYMEWVGMDADAMKESFVYVDPAHITSHNYTGTDSGVDRYWYFYAQQQGATFSNVFQYFRFDGTGVLGTVPVTLTEGDHYTIAGDPNVLPGVKTTITITPEDGCALSSILVNGEEYIQNAAYNADGSVELVLRPGEEGLTVSAETEAVTDGVKTLSGTVSLNKLNGKDTLDGVLVTYTGPGGEKPVTIDSEGNFALEGLEQGYYVLTAEKDGYQTISRGICLNRDIHTELVLEYDMFFTQNGTAFVLDEQNDGVVNKFGGTGYIMSNDSYNRFTYEVTYRYYEELAEEADTDAFIQQRSGMRILFSNGKYWYIDLVREGDQFIVQYAKHSNSIFSKWVTVATLEDWQVEKYKSEEGITLKVLRDGRYAAVYLDDVLLRVEKLDYLYSWQTAQLGMESWSANRGFMEIPYSITETTHADLSQTYFFTPQGWDITSQYNGLVALNWGGRGNLAFGEKYANMDLTLTVRDYDDPCDTYARNDVLLEFTNGAHVSFGVISDANGAWIQALNASANNGKQIYNRYKSFGTLTEEEFAQYKSEEGVDFRVLRIGTEVSLYIGDRLVAVADLTNNNSKVKANTQAKVTLRHYDDAGVYVTIPFEMTTEIDQVTVNCIKSKYGAVATNKQNYVVGDTVILSDSGEGDYYVVGMRVNGQTVELDADGTYSFVATESKYTVEGEFAKRIFNDSTEWNELQQCDGILTVPASDGDSGWITSYRTDYTDLDLKLTLRDLHTEDGNYRAAVRFNFANGEYVTFTLTNAMATDDDPTNYTLQNMGGSILNWTQVKGYSLSAAQVARLQSEGGLEFCIVRSGDTADLYVGGEHVCEMDLSTNKDGNASNVADQTTNIAIRLYGNTGEDVELPFTIDTELDKVTVNCTSSEYGAVSTAQKTYYLGDTVVLTSSDSSSHYCIGMTVDGKSVELAGDGTYSFIAAKSSYTVAGEFAQRIFKDSAEWNGFKQNEGTLSIPNSDGDSGWIETYRTDYQNFDFKVTLRDQDNAADNYRAGVRIYFTNDANIAISVTNDKANDDATTVYELQTMGGTMYNWKDSGYDLTAAQVAAIQSEAGLEMRIVRVGDVVDVYIGGVHAYEYDLSSGNVADLDARILLRFYGNTGKTVEVPFTLEETVDLVNVNVSAGKNGTITTDQKNYLSGDTVNLTVAGNAGYAHDSLTVNGQSVMTDLYGKYSFVITKDTTVKATFAKSIFKSTVSGWLLENQHYGQIAVNYTNGNGHSNWGDFADAYNDVDITITAREYADSVKPDLTRSAIRFTFTNGKIITFSIAKNTVSGGGYKYSIQSLSGDSVVGSNYDFYMMNDAQIAKFKGDAGIEFRVIRKGTKAYVYLDGELVVNGFDLTRNSSGVTADMAANITIRRYDDPNILAVYDNFSVSTTLPKVTVNIPTLKNGTVTADQDSYLPGETVTLTVAGNAGYAHDSLTVNGQSVVTDLYGKYSFVITEDTAVNATFAPSVFKSTVSGWLLENQHYGQIAVSENTGNSTWGDLAGEYGDIDITLTTKEFESTNELARTLIRFMFDNNKTFSVSVAKNKIGGKYEYTIESIGSGNLEAAGYDYYTLNDAQIAKYTGEGIAFRVIRSGTKVYVYLDGVLVVNGYDLTKGGTTGITADTKMNVTIRQYDTPNVVAVFDNFSVKSTASTVNIDIAATANGTITVDKTTCKLGDTVTLTVAGDSGYYHTGLYVNGQKVDVNWEGTYSFVAVEESYEVSCGFAAAVFTGGDTRYWDLFNHQVGELCVKSHTSGHSGWIDYTGTTNDVTTVVKNYNVSSKDFTMTYMFKFSNGETFNIRLHNTDDANIYRIQSMSSTLFDAWKTRYTLSDAEKAKVTGDGIEFRVIVLNSTAYVYLDGVQVCEYAFTKDVSAETVTVTLRMDGNLNNDAYLTYKLANTTELP